MHLLEVLREECGVVSAKNGCAPEGACGCCLVIIDGRPALSCLRKPEQMAGHDDHDPRGAARRSGARSSPKRSCSRAASSAASAFRASSCVPPRSSTRGRPTTATRSPRRSTATSAAAPATAASSTPSRRPARRARMAAAFRHEPRRHFYFGEEFGLPREPGVRGTQAAPERKGSSGHRRSLARLGGAGAGARREAIRRRHARPRDAAWCDGAVRASACADSGDPYDRSGRGMPGVVRIFTARDVPGERGTGLAIRICRSSSPSASYLLRRRLPRDGRRRHAVARAAGGEDREDRLRGARADHQPVRRARARRAAGAFGGNVRAEHRQHSSDSHDVRARRRRGGVRNIRRTSSTRRSRRSRSTSRFSSRRRVSRSRRARACKVHAQSQGSVYDQAQIARVADAPGGRRDCARRRAAAHSARRKSCRSRGRPRSRPVLLQRPVKTC